MRDSHKSIVAPPKSWQTGRSPALLEVLQFFSSFLQTCIPHSSCYCHQEKPPVRGQSTSSSTWLDTFWTALGFSLEPAHCCFMAVSQIARQAFLPTPSVIFLSVVLAIKIYSASCIIQFGSNCRMTPILERAIQERRKIRESGMNLGKKKKTLLISFHWRVGLEQGQTESRDRCYLPENCFSNHRKIVIC